jgi:hypothetical protein
MPSLEFFVISQSVSFDQRTDRLSIFEVIDSLSPSRFPAVIPRLIAISVWNLTPEDKGTDFQANLHVEGPGTPSGDFRQNFTGDGDVQRMIHHLVNVPITQPGIITVAILLNNQPSATHQIRVAAADAAADDDGFLVYPQLARND